MKLYEIAFCAVCATFCAVLFWAAVNLDEAFYICMAVFSAGFWGAMAALCVWGRISAQQRDEYKPTIIWPHGRRP